MPNKHETTERQREIEQGLREPSGALIGGLDVLEYSQGHKDYDAGMSPPQGITSVSYDLGRKRAAEAAEQKADILREINERQEESHRRIREMLSHRPDLLAEFNAKLEAIGNAKR